THRSVVNFVSTCQELFSITPADRLLQFANPAFDVSVFDIYAALGCGAGVVAAPKSDLLDTDRLTTLMREHRVTVTTPERTWNWPNVDRVKASSSGWAPTKRTSRSAFGRSTACAGTAVPAMTTRDNRAAAGRTATS
ncbi:AMP-binding protein, partial [Kibdelosporangium lantanae]